MELRKHASIKPGSWIRIPIQYETKCNTQQSNAYHHAIIICPLLEIGFNAAGTIIDKLHITSTNRIYDCSKYEIIDEPSDYKQCEDIIRRSLRYYGARKYSQMFNNCEHFASFCFNNKSESKQVKHSFWSSTSSLNQYIQRSSLVTQTVLFLNSYNIVSDTVVDNVCCTSHKLGKLNANIVDFCEQKANENEIENEYNIKGVEETFEHLKIVKNEVNEHAIVEDAKSVRMTIRENENDKGRIDNDKIECIINAIRPILRKYYLEKV